MQLRSRHFCLFVYSRRHRSNIRINCRYPVRSLERNEQRSDSYRHKMQHEKQSATLNLSLWWQAYWSKDHYSHFLVVVLESDEGNCKFRVAGTERQTLMSFPDLHTRVTATNWPSSPEITVVFDDKRLWHRGHNWLFCLYCISVMCLCVWCYWWLLLETKLKDKFHPITCHEGPRGNRGISLLFL